VVRSIQNRFLSLPVIAGMAIVLLRRRGRVELLLKTRWEMSEEAANKGCQPQCRHVDFQNGNSCHKWDPGHGGQCSPTRVLLLPSTCYYLDLEIRVAYPPAYLCCATPICCPITDLITTLFSSSPNHFFVFAYGSRFLRWLEICTVFW
jgi:hypothetical protein